MKSFVRARAIVGCSGLLFAGSLLLAQTVATPNPSPSATDPKKEDTVILSPFEVSVGSDEGYAARETLAGTRFKSNLKDVASQVSILTMEFLADTASVSIDDAYRYSLNVENVVEYNSPTAGGGDFTGGTLNLRSTNRIRGLTTPGLTHDFFLTQVLQDAYNLERVSVSSGPNAILFGNGSPGGIVDASFKRAIDKIKKAVDSGQVRQFTGNDYAPLLAKGDVWAATAWSGDVVQLQADNPHLKYVIPDSGGMIWTDNMLIPKKGKVYTASVFMNYVYRPKVAAQIEDYVNYICPVEGAKDVLLKSDPAVAKNGLIFPPQSTLDKVHIFDAKAADTKAYKEQFQTLVGA